ncbi:MAG: cysteine methyltransferase [Verrucomicrobia bacterium]|nr:cysteine methyltransferase [Verrucomicrobiota bacterium]
MSVGERLQTIEILWDSLRSDESVDSCEWHGCEWHDDVLRARKARVEAGAGVFLSIAELRARLRHSAS